MKYKHIVSTLIIGSCVTSITSYAADTENVLKIKNHIELMFFQQAQSGYIKATSHGCYDVMLSGIEPNVMYFSDSPNKTAGNLTVAQLAESMKHSQDIDKVVPNALLNMKLIENTKQLSVNMIGQLSNARYINKEFHYTFCLIEGNQLVKRGQIRSVNLFIDPIHRWPP
jgi:hypothetical protein